MESKVRELEERVKLLEKNLTESIKTQGMLLDVIENLVQADQMNKSAITDIVHLISVIGHKVV